MQVCNGMLKMNRKFAHTRPDGYFDVRVSHLKRKGKRDPRYLFRCGCCDNKFEIYYGGDSLEINGVMGSVENWRELLLPLLNMALPGQEPRKQAPPREAEAKEAAKLSGVMESAKRLAGLGGSKPELKTVPRRRGHRPG